MAILSCHVSIKLPPKISDGQRISEGTNRRDAESAEARAWPERGAARSRPLNECRGRGLTVPEADYPGLGAFSADGPAPGRNPNGWPISSSRAWISASLRPIAASSPV